MQVANLQDLQDKNAELLSNQSAEKKAAEHKLAEQKGGMFRALTHRSTPKK